MLDRLAWILSMVMSPFVVLPAFVLIFVSHLAADAAEFACWLLVGVLLSTAVPAVYVLYFWRTGRITDPHVAVREQRQGPFLASLLSFAALTAIMLVGRAPRPMVGLSLALLANAVSFGLITRRWKISLHAGVTASALSGAVVVLGWNPLWLLSVVPVIWARTRRGRHTISQGLVGAALGAALTAAVLTLVQGGVP